MNENHPWKHYGANALKLKAARAEAKRRYERTSEVRNDEYRALRTRQRALVTYRTKHGIPVDAPKIKTGRPLKSTK